MKPEILNKPEPIVDGVAMINPKDGYWNFDPVKGSLFPKTKIEIIANNEYASPTLNDQITMTREQLEYFIGVYSQVLKHVDNPNIHVTDKEKADWGLAPDATFHINNDAIHVSEYDRDTWNSKETPNGAQQKANIVQTNLNRHQTDQNVHVSIADKNKWNNTYSKEEIANLLNTFEYGLSWKQSVNTYADIERHYPNPAKGWTVNVLDTNITYQFNGTDWIAISANSMPIASESSDGLMTKEDKVKLNGVEDNANNYIHPNNAMIRHVTDDQINTWDSKADDELVNYTYNGLMSVADKKKLDGIEEGANNFELPTSFPASMIVQNNQSRFVTDAQIESWTGKASTTIASQAQDGLMSKEDKKKLDTIQEYANNFVLGDISANKVVPNSGKRFVTDAQIAKWDGMVSKSVIIKGTMKFNGTDGVRIIHDLLDVTRSYFMYVIPTSMLSPETLGNIVIDKGTNECFVYSTGNNKVDSFDYLILNI